MKSRFIVAAVALILPASLCACADLAETSGDGLYEWTAGGFDVTAGSPERIEVILQHPDSDTLTNRVPPLRFQGLYNFHGLVHQQDGSVVQVWGDWDLWGNLHATGGGYYMAGYMDGVNGTLEVRFGSHTWIGDLHPVQPGVF